MFEADLLAADGQQHTYQAYEMIRTYLIFFTD